MGLVGKVACPLFLLLACSDFDELRRNKPHRLTVSVVDLFHFDGGTFAQPASGTMGDIAVYVDNADHGWNVLNGTWLDAGIAVVDDVPPGFTLIARPDDPVFFSIGGATEVDLGTDFIGPPATTGGTGTIASFTATGAVETDAGTFVTVRAPDYGIVVDNVTAFDPPGFAALREASADSFVFDHDWSLLPLPTDQTVQLVELPLLVLNDGSMLWTAAKAGTGRATLSTGVPKVVDVPLSDPPAGNIPASSFDLSALTAAVSTNVPDAGQVGVWARTLLADSDAYSALPVQALFVPAPGASVTAPAMTVQPFPGQPLLQVQLVIESQVTVGTASETSLISASATGPIGDEGWKSKAVLPVGELVVSDASGILAPTLSWSGTAQYYAVAALALAIDDTGALVSTPVDYYVVFGNECRLRPNVLQVGTPYVFIVEAIDCGQTLQTSPLRTTPSTTCSNAYNRTLVYLPQSG
jgi:hypothetical protein